MMQPGFAFLEAGAVQSKNSKNVLFKNLMDLAIGSLAWWMIGFGIAGTGASGMFE